MSKPTLCHIPKIVLCTHGRSPLLYRAARLGEFAKFTDAADKTLVQRLFQYVSIAYPNVLWTRRLQYIPPCWASSKRCCKFTLFFENTRLFYFTVAKVDANNAVGWSIGSAMRYHAMAAPARCFASMSTAGFPCIFSRHETK